MWKMWITHVLSVTMLTLRALLTVESGCGLHAHRYDPAQGFKELVESFGIHEPNDMQIWLKLGDVIMDGFTCHQRLSQRQCPGQPSCHQLVAEVFSPQQANNRYRRHAPDPDYFSESETETDHLTTPSVHYDPALYGRTGRRTHKRPQHHDSLASQQAQAGPPVLSPYKDQEDTAKISPGRRQNQRPQQRLQPQPQHQQLRRQQQRLQEQQQYLQGRQWQGHPTQRQEQKQQRTSGRRIGNIALFSWLPPHPQTPYWLLQDQIAAQNGRLPFGAVYPPHGMGQGHGTWGRHQQAFPQPQQPRHKIPEARMPIQGVNSRGDSDSWKSLEHPGFQTWTRESSDHEGRGRDFEEETSGDHWDESQNSWQTDDDEEIQPIPMVTQPPSRVGDHKQLLAQATFVYEDRTQIPRTETPTGQDADSVTSGLWTETSTAKQVHLQSTQSESSAAYESNHQVTLTETSITYEVNTQIADTKQKDTEGHVANTTFTTTRETTTTTRESSTGDSVNFERSRIDYGGIGTSQMPAKENSIDPAGSSQSPIDHRPSGREQSEHALKKNIPAAATDSSIAEDNSKQPAVDYDEQHATKPPTTTASFTDQEESSKSPIARPQSARAKGRRIQKTQITSTTESSIDDDRFQSSDTGEGDEGDLELPGKDDATKFNKTSGRTPEHRSRGRGKVQRPAGDVRGPNVRQYRPNKNSTSTDRRVQTELESPRNPSRRQYPVYPYYPGVTLSSGQMPPDWNPHQWNAPPFWQDYWKSQQAWWQIQHDSAHHPSNDSSHSHSDEQDEGHDESKKKGSLTSAAARDSRPPGGPLASSVTKHQTKSDLDGKPDKYSPPTLSPPPTTLPPPPSTFPTFTLPQHQYYPNLVWPLATGRSSHNTPSDQLTEFNKANFTTFSIRVLFAAFRMDAYDCDESYLLHPREWVDMKCGVYASHRGSRSVLDMILNTLQNKLNSILQYWDFQRVALRPQTVAGIEEAFIHQQGCFSIRTLVEKAKDEKLDGKITTETCHRDFLEFLGHLATSLFVRLLRGETVGPETAPCPTDFTDEIFRTFGVHHADCPDERVISLEGLETILNTSRSCAHKQAASSPIVWPWPWPWSNHEPPRYTQYRLSPHELVELVLRNNSLEQLNVQQFYQLCPSLLQQLLLASSPPDTEANKDVDIADMFNELHTDLEETIQAIPQATAVQSYGLGTAAVAAITLCSLIAAVTVKMCHSASRHYAMAAMLALAVGSLSGDAALHLLPQGLQSRNTANCSTVHHLPGDIKLCDSRLKALALLVSIYLLWLLELLTSHSHGVPDKQETSVKEKYETGIVLSNIREMTEVSSPYEVIRPAQPPKPTVTTEIGQFAATSRELVLMIMVGDAAHNIADGLAIGAAFAHSVPLGLSTSLAVLFHEIPHELGDFAVVLSTGMSLRRALLLNMLSSLLEFVGLYVGLAAGAGMGSRQWMFLAVAGLFMYISLANIIPELVRYFRHFRNPKMFILQNLGILLGFAVMFLLVLLEDKIQF